MLISSCEPFLMYFLASWWKEIRWRSSGVWTSRIWKRGISGKRKDSVRSRVRWKWMTREDLLLFSSSKRSLAGTFSSIYPKSHVACNSLIPHPKVNYKGSISWMNWNSKYFEWLIWMDLSIGWGIQKEPCMVFCYYRRIPSTVINFLHYRFNLSHATACFLTSLVSFIGW